MTRMEPFTIDDARRGSLTPHHVRKLVGTGAVVRVSRGAFAGVSEAETLRGRSEALCAVLPRWAIGCRRTAAWLWGLDVLPPGVAEARWPVEIVVPAGMAPARRPGCRAYQADLPAGDVVDASGIRVTSPERTALDCARFLPRLEAVAALDQFLRRGVDPAALTERAAVLAGRRNVARLRAVLDAADAGAESPGESWTRVLVLDAGLPRPATQVPVRLPGGRLAYLDMGVEGYATGIEYDGEEHHTGGLNEAHDAERRRRLREAGWVTVVAGKQHVLGDPRPFLGQVAETLLSRGWAPSPERLDDVMRRIAFLSTHPQ